MKRPLWITVSLMLAAIIALSIARPHIFVSPGNLAPAHAELKNDCFACHTPFRGAASARCISCHAVADIGLRTTKGDALPANPKRRAFHQALIKADCLGCHREHASAGLAQRPGPIFDHVLLSPDARSKCQTCHEAPRDALHTGQTMACATCHQPPHWKPATFDHRRFFPLEGAHTATCATCHPDGNYKRYTCYGCHEHDPARVIAQHREEGITNLNNCVRCHRNGRSEEGEGGERGGGEREGGD